MIIFLQVVCCFFLGAIFGNICTTLFFRIPRNIPINGLERPPMCSNCGIKIKYPYYAPFFQFLLKGLKCFNCKAKIPIIYTFIEFFSGVFSVLFFLFFKVNEYFITCYLGLLVIFLSCLIFIYHKLFFDKLNWIIILLSLIKLHFEIPSQDSFIFYIVFYRLMNGLVFIFIAKQIIKKVNIQFVCFFIAIALFINQIHFVYASLISLLLLSIFKDKKSLFLVPFMITAFKSLI